MLVLIQLKARTRILYKQLSVVSLRQLLLQIISNYRVQNRNQFCTVLQTEYKEFRKHIPSRLSPQISGRTNL